MRITGSDQPIVLQLLGALPRRAEPTSVLVNDLPPAGPAPVSSLVLDYWSQIPRTPSSFERIDAARRRLIDMQA